MSSEELAKELQEIERIAREQRAGRYTTESDAVQALELLQRLAKSLLAAHVREYPHLKSKLNEGI